MTDTTTALHEDGSLERLTIDTIRISLRSPERAILLKELEQDRQLPIFIHATEAEAIAAELGVTPLIDNRPGAGGNIGSKFEDLGRIIKQVGNPRVKVCLDTQHSYAAGYDLGSAEGLELAMTEFEQEVGFEGEKQGAAALLGRQTGGARQGARIVARVG